MTNKEFSKSLKNLTEGISVTGTPSAGELMFHEEIYLTVSGLDIQAEIEGNQKMQYISGEEEVGLESGWYICNSCQIEIDSISGISAFDSEDLEVELTSKQQEELLNYIKNNLSIII